MKGYCYKCKEITTHKTSPKGHTCIHCKTLVTDDRIEKESK